MALGLGAPVAAVAAGGLAVDDAGADGLLAPPVGGVDAGPPQEGERGGAFVGQMLEQPAVGFVPLGLFDPQVNPLADVLQSSQASSGGQGPGVECFLQQPGDPSGGAFGPSG